MLRVTIELLPFGDLKKIRLLDSVQIVNDGSGSHEVGNYTVFCRDQQVRVEGHERADGALSLVVDSLIALQNLREEARNKHAG